VPAIRDLIAAGDVLLLPQQTFRMLRRREPFVVVWLAVSLTSAALTLSQLEIVRRATAFFVARGAPSEIAPAADALLSRWTLTDVWLAPVGTAARWCAEAALVQLGCRIARRRRDVPVRGGFRSLLCVIAYASVPGVLAQAIDLWVTWRDGPGFTPELLPLRPAATALDAWLPLATSDPLVGAALGVLTPFAVWELILRIIGLREMCGARRRTAFVWAAPAWLAIRLLSAYFDTPGISSSWPT